MRATSVRRAKNTLRDVGLDIHFHDRGITSTEANNDNCENRWGGSPLAGLFRTATPPNLHATTPPANIEISQLGGSFSEQ